MESAARDFDAALVPNSECWGQGFADSYNGAELREIASNVDDIPPQGYGPRFIGMPTHLESRLLLPEGHDALYERDGDQGGMDPSRPTVVDGFLWQTNEGVQQWARSRGWSLDQHGRPCHPHHFQLLNRVGMNTGAGFGYFLGEQVVVDAVLLVGDKVLLIDRPFRTEPGTFPALPGGYAISADFGRSTTQWLEGDRPVTHEGIVATAARKLREETGVDLPWDTPAQIVRAIRPVSSVHTLNFWTTTFTVRFRLSSADDLAIDPKSSAKIVSGEPVDTSMWPDHRRALLAAMTLA